MSLQDELLLAVIPSIEQGIKQDSGAISTSGSANSHAVSSSPLRNKAENCTACPLAGNCIFWKVWEVLLSKLLMDTDPLAAPESCKKPSVGGLVNDTVISVVKKSSSVVAVPLLLQSEVLAAVIASIEQGIKQDSGAISTSGSANSQAVSSSPLRNKS